MEREELMEILEGFKKDILSSVKPQVESEAAKPSTGKHSELVSELLAAMDARNKTDAQKVYDTMFEEKVSALTAQYPAFGEYLNSEDDFGEVVLDRIKKIPDYAKRVTAFDKVFKNFASAQTGDGQNMRMSKATKKQVEDDAGQREAIKEKFIKGEMNLEDFTQQYFGTVENQIERLKG